MMNQKIAIAHLLRPDKGRMKASSEPIAAITARVTSYRIATVLPDYFDMYHRSNGASHQNSAGIADWKSKSEI